MALKLKKAEPTDTRLKMYIYGDTGTGKTVTSLHFPNPYVIDTEGGTSHYAKFFDFYLEKTSDPEEINKIIDELIEDPQGIKTLIIDPFTVLYDTILTQQETRLKKKTNNPNYVLEPKDYRVIKSIVKNLVLKLLALDMNIIVTARSVTEYSKDKDKFMEVVGTKADGPKDLPYLFDVVLELTNVNGAFMATVKKDRTNMLPKDVAFPFNYGTFTKYLGISSLEREPVVFNQKNSLNKNSGRVYDVEFKGKTFKTAGITSESLTAIDALSTKVGLDVLKEKLRDGYSVESVFDLKNDEAELLIKDLETIVNK